MIDQNVKIAKQNVIIIGAFHEIIELAEEIEFNIVGMIDNVKTESYRGYKILHNDSDDSVLSVEFIKIPLIITPDSPFVRMKLRERYYEQGFHFINLISKKANISRSATIGIGVIIQSGVNLSSESIIGDFVKLNTYCNVMHNSFIDEYTTIAPNAVVLGNVKIGKCCYIGANSTILPNLTICDEVTIGAGSVVTKHISQPGKYAGVPARRL